MILCCLSGSPPYRVKAIRPVGAAFITPALKVHSHGGRDECCPYRSAVSPLRMEAPFLCVLTGLHINATINVEGLTGDVVSIHDQVSNGASYLLRCTCPTEWYPLEDSLFGLLGNIGVHLRLDKPRANRVDCHSIAGQ